MSCLSSSIADDKLFRTETGKHPLDEPVEYIKRVFSCWIKRTSRRRWHPIMGRSYGKDC